MTFEILIISMIAVVLLIIAIYNGIIRNKNSAIRAWSDIVAYERQKLKVLPDIELLLKEYKQFEETVLVKVTELREAISKLDEGRMSNQDLQTAELLTTEVIQGMKLTVENYPELKTVELAENLMREISEQQSNVTAAITVFNRSVEIFNNGIQTFPSSLVNSHLNKEELLESFQNKEAQDNLEWTPSFAKTGSQ